MCARLALRSRRLLAAALLAALMATPSLATAQEERAAVVAMGGSAGIDAAIFTQLVDSFEDRLHASGFVVDTSGTPRLPDACHRECRSSERAERDLDVLVVLTLEQEAGRLTHVLVSVLDALAEYSERESVGEREPLLVAELAIVRALGRRERGRRPWLSVHGTPEAAYVAIDGHDVGLLPWEGEVEAGERELGVHLDGYETDRRTIVAAPGAPVDVEIALVPSGSSGASGGDSLRTGLGLGAGIPLVLVGVALLATGGWLASVDGTCASADCSAGYTVDGATYGGVFGAGGAAAVAGAVGIVVGAF